MHDEPEIPAASKIETPPVVSDVPSDAVREDTRRLIREAAMQKALKQYDEQPLDPYYVAELKEREQLEVICKMTYAPLLPEDLLKPHGVSDMYAKALINDAAIRAILTGNSEESFERETKRGIFVFGFSEEPKNRAGDTGVSVCQQMHADLARAPDAKGDFIQGKYIGRCLKTTEGRIVAYVTCELPPTSSQFYSGGSSGIKSPYQKKMLELFDRGVTGGGMQYISDLEFLDFKNIVLKAPIVNFDTICSDPNFDYAAKRLFALFMEEIMQLKPAPQYLFLYRLGRLRTEPAPPQGSFPVIGENSKSANFFAVRKCKNFATDFNKDGYYSTREVDGQVCRLLPSWAWMGGSIKNIHRESMRIWNNVLLKHNLRDRALSGADK